MRQQELKTQIKPITEFRRLGDDENPTDHRAENKSANGKYRVVKGEGELVKRLDEAGA